MNTRATRRLAELAKAAGVGRYLFASSCSVYDRGAGNEEGDQLLDEQSAVEPKAAYSSSKYQAEKLLLELADDKFCPVILRKSNAGRDWF